MHEAKCYYIHKRAMRQRNQTIQAGTTEFADKKPDVTRNQRFVCVWVI